jgi:sporulation protein YlmC with PRC-barrel domain
MDSNVVQSSNTTSNTESSVITNTGEVSPESSTGQAVANVALTPIAPTATPTVVVQVTRVVTATRVVTNTEAMTAVATPQPNQTAQPSQGQTLTGTAPLAAGTVFSGVAQSQGKAILLSTLLGSKFLTSDGAISGKLDDVVIDMQSSQLLYLMLTYGGFLNVGEKRVAVPLNAMSLKQDGTFLLNVPPNDLEKAPDLADDWPQAGSPKWDTDVRNFWHNEGFDVTFDPSVSGNRIRRINDWIGSPLNDVGLGAGTVQDMIVALDQGRVPYVLASFVNAPAVNGTPKAAAANGAATATPVLGGATAGAGTAVAGGSEWYVIPLSAFDPQNPTLSLRSNINAATFEGAPRFNTTTYGNNAGQNPFLPNNYDNDWRNFWNKLTNQ